MDLRVTLQVEKLEQKCETTRQGDPSRARGRPRKCAGEWLGESRLLPGGGRIGVL